MAVDTYRDSMGMFSRGSGSRQLVSSNEQGSLDHQEMAGVLLDAFAEHDAAGLAALDAAGRAEQFQARWAMFNYLDRIWDDAKARGLDPGIRPEWSVVAGLRDLTTALVGHAEQAQFDAGDEDAG